jgi:methyltransferase-like protein
MSINLRVNKAWDTPNSLESLSKWLNKVDDPIVTKSAMMMLNYISNNYTLNVCLKERNNK